MKYKVGDKVRIKSIDWYNENKDADSCVHCGDRVFDNYMSVFCGSVVTISGVSLYGYGIREDLHCRTWTDEMIEGLLSRIGEGTRSFAEGQQSHTKSASELYEEYIESLNKETNKIVSNAIAGDMLAEKTMLDCILAKGLLIPNGYIFKDENGNVINATKIVLEKKKKEYPKTYEECYKIRERYTCLHQKYHK